MAGQIPRAGEPPEVGTRNPLSADARRPSLLVTAVQWQLQGPAVRRDSGAANDAVFTIEADDVGSRASPQNDSNASLVALCTRAHSECAQRRPGAKVDALPFSVASFYKRAMPKSPELRAHASLADGGQRRLEPQPALSDLSPSSPIV